MYNDMWSYFYSLCTNRPFAFRAKYFTVLFNPITRELQPSCSPVLLTPINQTKDDIPINDIRKRKDSFKG